jgi:ribosomal protein S18 acetylase RimI-like enzyme
MSAMAVVDRATADDWRLLRDVRLAALADSPAAFGSSLDREREYAEDDWHRWLATSAVFIAHEEDLPVAMVAGIEGEADDERRLVAMWVHPQHRGQGLGSSLVTAVVDWASEEGAHRLVLWVADGNDAALHLYRRHGFTKTGSSMPLPSNPTIDEHQMVLDLLGG